MRKVAVGALILGASGALGGCGEDDACRAVAVSSDQSCETTRDCIDEGFARFSCINGTCRLPCLSDADCAPPEAESGCAIDPGFQAAVCENQVCTVGCPLRECGAGQEVCADGRCAYFFEGFEAEDDTAPSFTSLGFNDLGRELDNNRSAILFSGFEGCEPGPNCSGPAASGQRFAVLATLPAPEKGTPETAPTCRACACCLGCRLDPPSQTLGILDCPRERSVPPRLYCGPPVSCDQMPDERIPRACEGVCAACEQCSDHPDDRAGRLLTSCEATAAAKGCPACLACDDNQASCNACRQTSCASACSDLSSDACAQCEADNGCPCQDCRDCNVCADAENCAAAGGSAEDCLALEAACDAQGVDGCFDVPIRYPRVDLTDGEQALESPPVDLAGASGDVVLEFSYVPFNVGRTYTRSEQGVSSCEWDQGVPQEVLVQFCASDCTEPSSWADAEGGRLPPPDQRGNNLRLAEQSGVDWRAGRTVISIPPSFRTSTFRFRFLPRLSESARFGVDDVRVRTR